MSVLPQHKQTSSSSESSETWPNPSTNRRHYTRQQSLRFDQISTTLAKQVSEESKTLRSNNSLKGTSDGLYAMAAHAGPSKHQSLMLSSRSRSGLLDTPQSIFTATPDAVHLVDTTAPAATAATTTTSSSSSSDVNGRPMSVSPPPAASASAEHTALIPILETKQPHVDNDLKVEIKDPAFDPSALGHLNTNPAVGLTDEEVAQRLAHYGTNELKEVKKSQLLKFLSYFTGPISYLIEAAVILSAVLEDWTDFGIILGLLIVNACIGFIEEARAESAVDALRSKLALKSKVMRNSAIVEVEAAHIVPGDILSLRLGDVIPADAILLGLSANGEPTKADLQIDQSALTGESLPVHKNKGGEVYSTSVVKQGQMLGIVTKTGERTFIGRAAHLMNITEESGHFQAVIKYIGNVLIAITLGMVLIMFIVGVARNRPWLHELEYALVLTIASIPVGLPTVLSVTMAVGAQQLASRKVIVKRLTAVEEMAGLDILCSDKTGTLTLNELTLDDPFLLPGRTNADLLMAAYLASEPGANDAIEKCVRESAVQVVPQLKGVNHNLSLIPGHRVLNFQPFDPISKLTRSTVLCTNDAIESKSEGGQPPVDAFVFNVAKGAPQVIQRLCKSTDTTVDDAIAKMASRGLRALGVARSKPVAAETDTVEWEMVGLLSLLDPPRPDSGSTIAACQQHGLSVKMVTGDAMLIAKEVCKRLGMHANILTPQKLRADVEGHATEEEVINRVTRCDGFAQVIPEDKFRVVELLQKGGHLVGMTGDGVNDAPALKKANVGIAVHGCTDAARSAADIVLLQPGLSAIVDGIMTSRAIFQRMRSYAVYRITSTIHFLLFLFFVIILYGFFLPPKLIVLIAMLNDAAVLVISVDNALVSEKPDKWRLGQMMTLSVILGLMLTAASFGHFFIAKDVFGIGANDPRMHTIMYLQMSSCPHFVIFSTRISKPFYTQPPSLVFFLAVFLTQVFAMFISVYGVLAHPIGWAWGASIMAISLVYFMFMDLVKCWLYSVWSFELTAKLVPTKERTKKLAQRRERRLTMDRYEVSLAKVRRVVAAVGFARKLRHYRPLPEAKIVHAPAHH